VRASRRGIFDREVVRRLVGEHVAGRVQHTERLWALINFELWQRRFMDGDENVRMSSHETTRHVVEVG